MSAPTLFLATDHAGFAHKNTLRDYLIEHDSHGYTVVDLGAFLLDETDDYPKYIARAARQVARNPDRDKAVIFGGSGQGEAIVANKFRGVRTTVYYGSQPQIIDLARAHNDTNILSIGARFVSDTETIESVQKWLASDFGNEERHARRLSMISNLEEKNFWNRFINMIRKKSHTKS